MDNERRVNKIHGILVEDSRVPELIKKVDEATPTVVVDSLPLENIKHNVIYAVKKVAPIYKIWLYGQSFNPLTSVADDPQLQEMASILVANGWTSEELNNVQLIMLGLFLPVDINVDGTILQNIVDSTGFTLKLGEGGTYIVNKKFSTIDETYTYLFSPEHAVDYAAADLQPAVETVQTLLKSKGFTWSNDPIEGIGIQAVVDENSTVSYEYYIYNGQQWVNLEGVKVVNELPSPGVGGVLYAVQSVDYYTSIFGTKMPTLTTDNTATWDSTQESLFDANNRTLDEKNAYSILSQFGFAVAQNAGIGGSTSGNDVINNQYLNDSYSFSLTVHGVKIAYDFETLLDLGNYLFDEQYIDDLLKLQADTPEEQEATRTLLTQYISTLKEMGFQFSTSALSSSQIGLVAENKFKYYLWDGSEYIEVEKNKTVFKSLGSGENLSNLTFTEKEFDNLYNGGSLIVDKDDVDITTYRVVKTGVANKEYSVCLSCASVVNMTNDVQYGDTKTGLSTLIYIRRKTNGTINITVYDYNNFGNIWSQFVFGGNNWNPLLPNLGDYKFYYDIYLGNINEIYDVVNTSLIYCSLAFPATLAVSGNFAPFGDVITKDNRNYARIYAKEKPTSNFNVIMEVIACQS